jgi:hypothetical protein
MRFAVPHLLLGLAGCGGRPIYEGPWPGTHLADFFTFATGADETWEFASSDPSVPYGLHASLAGSSETPEGPALSIRWTRVCLSDRTGCQDGDSHLVQWRVTPHDGVFVAALQPPGGALVDFTPDVQVALDEMDPGDTVETVSIGYTFASTFVGYAGCPGFRSEDWDDDCIELHLSDGDDDPWTNAGLTGTYLMIPRFDFVGYQADNEAAMWGLAAYACTGSGC